MAFQIPHPEDFDYKDSLIDNAKRMTREELQEVVHDLVLELRGVRRSLRAAMAPKQEPYGRFTVMPGKDGETQYVDNSGVAFTVQSKIPVRVEIWRLGQEAVLDKLAELPDEDK